MNSYLENNISTEELESEAKIIFKKDISGSSLSFGCACLYNLVEKQNYQKVTLDFTNVEHAYPDFMLPFIAQVRGYRFHRNIDFLTELPKSFTAKRFFDNTNYTFFLKGEGDIRRSPYYQNIPAQTFKDEDEQFEVVNRLLEWLLGTVKELKRDDLKAFEWALAEITDNVITHAEDPLGGLVQAGYFRKNNTVQFVICDAGIGIPTSLRIDSEYASLTDRDAVVKAIEESVTGKKSTNQGNGLYGTYELARHSEGQFSIRSGYGLLYLDKKNMPVIEDSKIPFNGTVIVCNLKLGNADLIAQALKIGGQSHEISYDYLDQISGEETDTTRIILVNENSGFASRRKAAPLRQKVINIVKTTGKKIILDFRDVHIISSSFADEFLAKMFDEFGPIIFMQKISIKNANKTVAALLDRAVLLRMSQNGK